MFGFCLGSYLKFSSDWHWRTESTQSLSLPIHPQPGEEGRGGCRLRSKKNNQFPYKNARLVEAASAHREAFDPRLHWCGREVTAGQSLDAHSSLALKDPLSLAMFLPRLTSSFVKIKSLFFCLCLSFPRGNIRVILSHLDNGDIPRL